MPTFTFKNGESASNEMISSPTIITKIPKELQTIPIYGWSGEDVIKWIEHNYPSTFEQEYILIIMRNECIDGKALLTLTEKDLRDIIVQRSYSVSLGTIKRFCTDMHELQLLWYKKSNRISADLARMIPNCECACRCAEQYSNITNPAIEICNNNYAGQQQQTKSAIVNDQNDEGRQIAGDENHVIIGDSSVGSTGTAAIGRQSPNIPPEIFKTAISLGYSFLVTWITSFVMVIVHERVPDMKRYPPLPDIFLDNVPHIPWAFHMCEITGALLFTIWIIVCVFHKYRLVLLRRFFALAGTVFLLRCVTMLITSLSVPGLHLQCDQADYAVDDTSLSVTEALELRITRAYTIWAGLGMSIQGVRTCGDYMFSGHTVALTLMNFFITEYTPRNLYFLHTLTWLLNMFGIFFILAAHEHYSIDVFVAFYITSRLFLYYHTLANNQALLSRDSNRTRIWFPMFSYFESSVHGIIPNEYDTVNTLLGNLCHYILAVKDSFMLTAQRYWIESPQLQNVAASAKLRHAATSTNTSNCSTPVCPNLPDNIMQFKSEEIKQDEKCERTTNQTENKDVNSKKNH